MEEDRRPPLSEEEKDGIQALVDWILKHPNLAWYEVNPWNEETQTRAGGDPRVMIHLNDVGQKTTISGVMAEAMKYNLKTTAKQYKNNVNEPMRAVRESWGIEWPTIKQVTGSSSKKTQGVYWILPRGWTANSPPRQIYDIIEALPNTVMAKKKAKAIQRKSRARALAVEGEEEEEQGLELGGMDIDEPAVLVPEKDRDYSLGLRDSDFEEGGEEPVEGRANMQSVVAAIMESIQRQEAKMDAVMQFLGVAYPPPPSSPGMVLTPPIAPLPPQQQQQKPASPLPLALQGFATYQGGGAISAEEERKEHAEREDSQFDFGPSQNSQRRIYNLLRNDNTIDLIGQSDFGFSQQGGSSQ